MICVRDELISYIRLRELFQVSGAAPAIEKIVIVQQAGRRVGLVVDRVLGTHQTVIQSLGRTYRDITVASGATIMGDGRVALIIDVVGLVEHADAERQQAARRPRAPARSFTTGGRAKVHSSRPVNGARPPAAIRS